MNSTAPAPLPSNYTATEIAKYHISPDVLMRWPVIAEWAASHDDDVADSVANLLDDMSGAEGETLDKVESFLERLPDNKYALEAVRADIETLKRLTAFREACSDALDVLDDDDAEDRILESIRLGEGMRRLRELDAASDEAIELMEELGVKS